MKFKLKKGPPKLLERRRVLFRLAVTCLVLCALPWLLAWPALNDRAALGQLERAVLLSPSEVVLQVGDTFLTEGEDWVSVSRLEEYIVRWKPLQKRKPYMINVIPKEGLVVAALPEVVDGVLTVAVTGLPAGAAEGTLSLTISGIENPYEGMAHMEEQETFTASADRQEAWMFFRLEAHDHGEGSWGICIMDGLWRKFWAGRGVPQYPYTLELRDSGGEVVAQTGGTLPPDRVFLNGDILYP